MRGQPWGMVALAVCAAAPPVEAQTGDPGPADEVVVGATLATGDGPSPLAMAGATVLWEALPGWGVEAAVDAWHGGFGTACAQIFPGSYACDVWGWSARAGVLASPVVLGRVRPYVDVSGGVHTRDGPAGDVTRSPLVVAGLGARVALGSRWGVRLGLLRHWILDRKYEDLMDEKLRLTAFAMGLDLRFPL